MTEIEARHAPRGTALELIDQSDAGLCHKVASMAAWAAIVIGLGSGIASGLIGTLATISHQRRAEFRTRMIEAADELVAGVTKAALVGRDVSVEISRINHEEGLGAASGVDSVTEGITKFERLIDVATVNVMRVSLLFGVGVAAEQASDFLTVLMAMRNTLYAESRGEGVNFDENFNAFIVATKEFIETARDEIRRAPLAEKASTIVRRLRPRFRKSPGA